MQVPPIVPQAVGESPVRHVLPWQQPMQLSGPHGALQEPPPSGRGAHAVGGALGPQLWHS